MMDTVSSVTEGNQARRDRIATLLRRYPDLVAEELDELIAFYKTAPPIDTALLTCEPDVARRAEQFQREHAKAVSRGIEAPWVLAIFVVFTIGILVAVALH